MSDFENLVRIARGQEQNHVEEEEAQPSAARQMDPETLERERIREQNPRYLAEKERIGMVEMEKNDSPFQHPCQNERNTMTLVSIDKCHEIDIEFDRKHHTAMVNLIRVEPSKKDSFLQLLHSVTACLREEKIEKVYQYVVISDWELSMSKIPEFKHVRTVTESDLPMPYVIVESSVDGTLVGIAKALGMNIVSHLDSTNGKDCESDCEDLDKA